MARILRSLEYIARPWKNGGGTTRDIVTAPPGASLDTFDWRLSLAQVDRDGPFSRFDNVDRTLVLLSGAMTLHEGERQIHLARNEPFAFAGERAIEATVGGGATLDFNVMTRRGRAKHAARRESFSQRSNIEASAASVLVIFALERGLIVDGERLDLHDTAIIDARRVSVAAAADSVAALVVEIVDIHPNVL
ncbi:MAG TPA: HutD family protein [Steroidobacteraceae bacterium]|nr:HutD family protein [Steroidobacteraceae bacterium]